MRNTSLLSLLITAGLGLGLVVSSSSAFADVLATDTASNYAGIGWGDGSNLGSGTPGFTTPWSVPTSGTANGQLSTTSALGPYAWELNAADDGNSGAGALRGFPEISDNDSVIVDLDLNNVASDGFAGVYLLNSAFIPEFQLYVQPAVASADSFGLQDYLLQDQTGPIDTGLVADGTPVHLDLTLVSAATRTYTVSLKQGSQTYSQTGQLLAFPGQGQIDTVEFANQNAGTPFDFNNLTVTPLPAAVLGAAPLLGLLAINRKRRV